MIWLKDDKKITAYVPQIDKRFTDSELFELNAHCPYEGWSKLAEFVMMTQGISFENEAHSIAHRHVEAMPLADIDFVFNFECFDVQNYETELYTKDIHNVFENLKLCKVFTKDIVVLHCSMKQVPKYWKHIVTEESLNNMSDDLEWTIQKAQDTSDNLNNLFKEFERLKLSIPDIICDKSPDSLLSSIYDKRKSERILNSFN